MRVAHAGWRVGALVLIGVANAAAQPSSPTAGVVVRGELGARADSFLTRAALHGFSGAIVVAEHGEIVLRKGYGIADRERRTSIGPETPFFIGSLAKQFTAAAILRLCADRRLALTDSLGALFPDAPADKRGITVRQLLSHTSGLPYLPSAGLFGRGTRDSVMREMLAERLLFQPGTRYEYSTPGYILLAGVIERASGITYEQYLRSLFERARLTSTGFVGERTRWSAAPVRSYSDANEEDLLEDVPALPRFVGAGSIVSTVGDLYRWYDALVNGEILPDAKRDLLFAPVVRLRSNLQEALTWMLIDLPTGTLRQAAGDIGGFNAELRHYVDEGLVVAFASNARVRGRGYREIVMNYIARMSRGERVPFPPEISDVPESRLQSMPGTYTLSDGGTVVMWASGDSLMVGATDAPGIALLAGQDSSASMRAAELTERATRFLASVDSDSVARAFMHASIPADARAMYLARLRAALGDSASRRATVIGTAVDSPMGARSYVRLRRDTGDEIVSLVWNGGMLIGLEPSGRAAYALRLRAEAPDTLTSFDLFTGHLVRIELLSDRELGIESNGLNGRAAR
jgi:CubicO group peptidase (beta-lactamase class C family)